MAYVDVKCASCGHESLVDPLVAARMKTCPACGAALASPSENDALPTGDTSRYKETNPPAITDAGATPAPQRPRWRLFRRRPDSHRPAATFSPAAVAKPSATLNAENPPDGGAATADSGSQAGTPSLRLNRTGTLSGDLKLCPSCGAIMQPAEKICTMCGYNTVTSRFVQQEHARREFIRRSLATLAVVLVLGVGGWLAYRRGALPHQRQWPRFFVPPPPHAPASETAAGPPAPRARTEEEIAELAAAFENTVRRELDERYPSVLPGVRVELVRTNGVAITGVFRGLTPRGGALLDVERVLQEIPLDDLRPASRVRVDEAYREARIKAEARRRAETGQVE